MKVDTLSCQQLNMLLYGKHIRTTDRTLAPDGAGPPIDEDEHYGGFGGEGVVEEFYHRDGHMWLAVDWGFEWIITANTDIEVITRGS